VFLCCAFALYSDYDIPANLRLLYHKQTCINIGNVIVIAIEKYHFDNNEYPEQLKQLVPDYLEEIPKHRLGTRKWKYVREENRFQLTFMARPWGYPSYSYNSETGKWSSNGILALRQWYFENGQWTR
ncbi:MAG: hypothetical protein LBB88_00395, partial [Planctomycetaceae bacterium]|nr:hypothetical protein [Planctomycetaceae bacterium]